MNPWTKYVVENDHLTTAVFHDVNVCCILEALRTLRIPAILGRLPALKVIATFITTTNLARYRIDRRVEQGVKVLVRLPERTPIRSCPLFHLLKYWCSSPTPPTPESALLFPSQTRRVPVSVPLTSVYLNARHSLVYNAWEKGGDKWPPRKGGHVYDVWGKEKLMAMATNLYDPRIMHTAV